MLGACLLVVLSSTCWRARDPWWSICNCVLSEVMRKQTTLRSKEQIVMVVSLQRLWQKHWTSIQALFVVLSSMQRSQMWGSGRRKHQVETWWNMFDRCVAMNETATWRVRASRFGICLDVWTWTRFSRPWLKLQSDGTSIPGLRSGSYPSSSLRSRLCWSSGRLHVGMCPKPFFFFQCCPLVCACLSKLWRSVCTPRFGLCSAVHLRVFAFPFSF